MLPKRPKGLQKSNVKPDSNVLPSEKVTSSSSGSITTNESKELPILMDDDESIPSNDLEACLTFLKRARNFFSQQENFEVALTLLRGTIHECHRLLTLPEYKEKPELTLALSRALYLLGIYKTEEDSGSDKEFFEFALETLDSLTDHDTTYLEEKNSLKLALNIALVIGTDEFKHTSADLTDFSEGEAIHLIHFTQLRRSDKTPTLTELDFEQQLWENCIQTISTSFELGKGNFYLQKANTIFNELTKDLDENSICEDPSTFEVCLEQCRKALEHLYKALELEDHPCEKNFIPLAECYLLQANIGDILEHETKIVYEHYSKASKYFETALMHDPNSVDDEIIDDLKEILSDLKNMC